MITNLIRIALRVFLRNWMYSAVNVAGLALGLAACTVLLLYVRFESSYDRFHPHSERLYRIVTSDSPRTPIFLGTELKLSMPEIEAMARITTPDGFFPTIGSDKVQRHQRADMAEAGFFEMFEFAFLAGDPVSALNGSHRMVISAEAAQLYFGGADPMGRKLHWDDSHSYTVTGVFKRREDTHFDLHLVGSLSTTRSWPFNPDHAAYESGPVVTYLRLAPYASDEGFFERALQLLPDGPAKEHLLSLQEQGDLPRLQPVLDVHLLSAFTEEYRVNGSASTIATLAAIAGFILLMAIVNFTNLTTSRSATRRVEVGVRKALGAARGQLASQFLGEAVALSLSALPLAMVLAELALPLVRDVTGRDLALLSDLGACAWMAVLALAGGVLGGLYAASLLSRPEPAGILRASRQMQRGGEVLRRGLVVFQFATAIAIISGTIAVLAQCQFLRQKELGFEKELVLVFCLGYEGVRERIQSVRQEMLRVPGVLGMTLLQVLPFDSQRRDHTAWKRADLPDPVLARDMHAEPEFLDLFDIDLVAGRPFRSGGADWDAVLVNGTALSAFGFDSAPAALGMSLKAEWGHEYTIVGVIPDLHLDPLDWIVEPLVVICTEGTVMASKSNFAAAAVRGDLPRTLAGLEDVWSRFFPDLALGGWFLDDDFDDLYREEERLGWLLAAAAFLAIAIAALGVLAMSANAAEQRTREIGIRKALGATESSIVALLGRELGLLVVVAAVIATPVAAITVGQWMERFAYRVDLGAMPFLAGGGAALLVAMLASTCHALRAARTPPVTALRHE